MNEKIEHKIPYTLHWAFPFPDEESKTPNCALLFKRAFVLEPFALDLKKALEYYYADNLGIKFKHNPAKVDPWGFPSDHKIGKCAIYLIYDDSSEGAIASLRARRPIDTQMTLAVRKNNRFNALTFLNDFIKMRYYLKGELINQLPREQFYEPRMFL